MPNARIIHCRRDPVDTCLSCCRKLFYGEQPFAYELAELGHFYLDYQALMEHWREVLPKDRSSDVDYEAVVDNLEGQARPQIGFIGLLWDNAYLMFHDTVRTASVTQVRQPIYAGAGLKSPAESIVRQIRTQAMLRRSRHYSTRLTMAPTMMSQTLTSSCVEYRSAHQSHAEMINRARSQRICAAACLRTSSPKTSTVGTSRCCAAWSAFFRPPNLSSRSACHP
jgi:hypothetical protein